ncbi:MAG TPA: PDZ domain-containing protein [Pirellulaceae bacterium]|jgi:C-terminal processing protease CtpA/Prc
MKTTLFSFARKGLASGAILLAAGWSGAAAQDPSGNNQNPSGQDPSGTSRQEARDTAKEKTDAAKAQKQGAREEIRDAREGARDTARDDRQTTRNAKEGARDDVRGARVEKRDAVYDAREGGRDTARDDRQTTRDAREGARDTVGDERRTIRDARRDVREARREFIASRIRSGDLGLWFRRMTDGLAVSDIARSGAISQSGLKEGDTIVSVNGQTVSSERGFVDQLFAGHDNNKPAQVVVKRNGQEQMLWVQTKPFVDEHLNSDDRLRDFGLILDQENPNHVKVQAVIPQSPAFYAGVKGGDVITGIGGQRVAQLADFIKSLAGANNSTAQLDVNRNNQQRQLEIEVPDPFQNQARTALRPNFDANGAQQPAQQQPAATNTTPNNGSRVPANTQPRLINPPRQ